MKAMTGEEIAAELTTAREQIDQLRRMCEGLRYERDHARAKTDSAIKLLVGIHALMYPAPFKAADGRTMVFRPSSPDPSTVLQELSGRIRALPDELRLDTPAPPGGSDA